MSFAVARLDTPALTVSLHALWEFLALSQAPEPADAIIAFGCLDPRRDRGCRAPAHALARWTARLN